MTTDLIASSTGTLTHRETHSNMHVTSAAIQPNSGKVMTSFFIQFHSFFFNVKLINVELEHVESALVSQKPHCKGRYSSELTENGRNPIKIKFKTLKKIK